MLSREGLETRRYIGSTLGSRSYLAPVHKALTSLTSLRTAT